MRVRTSSATTPTVPEGILDIYTGAAAAYSLRKLRKAYTGAAIRIRRDDDNLEVDVPFDGFNGLGASGFETFLRSFCGGFGTNYVLGSETFDPAFWTYNNTTRIANAGASPISTSNASKLLESNTTNGFNVGIEIGSSGGGTRLSTSYYVKAAERNFAYVMLLENVSPFAVAMVVVNLTTLQTQENHTLPNNEFSNISFFAQSVGNGWVRISISADVNTLNTVASFVGIATSLTTITYAGNSSSGIFIWGAQAQEGNTDIYDWKGNTASASAFVTTWYDQSGNARNAVQATSTLQPRIVNSGVVEKQNSIISISFDGAGNRLISSSNIGISGNQQFSIFMLTTFSLPSQQVNLSFGTAATASGFHLMGSGSSNDLWIGFGGGTQLATATAINPSSLRLYSVYRTGATGADWVIRSNRTNLPVVVGNNNVVNVINAPLVIGAWVGLSNFASIRCNEIILFPSNQVSVGNTIETNALSYYGIT